MDRLRDEVSRPRLFIKLHQTMRIPLLGLPERNDVLIANLRRMPVMLDLVLVIGSALLIELSRVPIAHSRHRLRPPVSPDAELCIAKPLWALVFLQRLGRRLELPLRLRLCECPRCCGHHHRRCDGQRGGSDKITTGYMLSHGLLAPVMAQL